ncbi:hypothetical protein BKA82DRAFT_4325516 [Pisolithus tinctorius]|uniref:Uncharacterized protein n=1 Tax=Pisolithus tinctorius Marx 270 TaxID=870435 RepID=A0A0C3NMX9_PISTI|nr:hypothetical protein BKA82DRAFT_4325516 [Pisolithus tinctorius]KIN96683.1 hypothetical protein M404DRAFT_16851 [Pisolithus tinctorius Marx 270]
MGCFQELSSWQKSFKHEWQHASNTPITIPLNDKYQPDTHKWVCTCPYLVKSQFLISKPLVQSVHMVSPIFFLEQVDRGTESKGDMLRLEEEMLDEGGDKDACEHIVDTVAHHSVGMDTHTFQECFQSIIMNFHDFCDGLEYQIQFNDRRMLHTVKCEGASFIQLMENLNSSLRQSPTTWEKGTANAMFYCTWPSLSDQAT